MSVKIKLPPASKVGSSNKPILVELASVAIFDPTHPLKPRVLGPIIDKISITFDIKDEIAREAIAQQFEVSLEGGGPYSHASPSTKAKSLYRINALLTEPSSGQAILIQVGRKKKSQAKASTPTKASPAKKKLAFMRLEFNPDRLGPKGVAFLQHELATQFLNEYSWADIAMSGHVTRIDLAADVLYVRSDQLIYSSAKGG